MNSFLHKEHNHLGQFKDSSGKTEEFVFIEAFLTQWSAS